MELPREVTIECPTCGHEMTVTVDLAYGTFWAFACTAPGCGKNFSLAIAFDVNVFPPKRQKFFAPRLADGSGQ